MSRFDKALYKAMLHKLEATELRLSEVRHENNKLRLDSGYFAKPVLAADKLVRAYPGGFDELGALFSRFVKGIFDINAESYAEQGVPFLRILNLRNGTIDESNLALIPEPVHLAEAKTELLRGEIVLSKTAYPAASLVTVDRCNTSQDTIATTLSAYGKREYRPEAVVAYLNSSIGKTLLLRQFQGNVQLHLGLDDGRKVPIPRLGKNLQSDIAKAFQSAETQRRTSLGAMERAELLMTTALGLDKWSASEPLTYTRNRVEVFDSGRLDAQFFTPRNLSLLRLLGRDNQSISDMAPVRHEKFVPLTDGTFNYLEIGGVRSDGSVGSLEVAHQEAPSRASQIVRKGDVITSMVRPIRRLSALVEDGQDGNVCSSGFVVLEPKHVLGSVLLVYLRLPLVCELMDLFTSATMYPAISEHDLLAIPIPAIEAQTQSQVNEQVTRAREAKWCATTLLDAANKAVDVALADSEAAASDYLNRATETVAAREPSKGSKKAPKRLSKGK